MKKSKYLRLLAIIVAVLVLLSTLSGCQNWIKFDSPESMISEMTGTYSGSNEHSGERIVIDGNSIIKFNIDDIFPQITDENFFWENFPEENWEAFDIDALLGKPYIEITTEPISANMKKSTISGLWVKNDGVLYSQEGYPFNKISSDPTYPTSEMQEKFEEYHKYLQEYEKTIIIAEAESDFSEKQESLNLALSSATSSNSTSQKSTASAETIANCAFDSYKDHLKYPRTATLYGWSQNPQYDPYGRVCTLITVTAQNGFGNYITEDVYVVLQSCSDSGYYTYKPDGVHYTTDKDSFDFLLLINNWNEDPSTDDTKEAPYNEAIQLIKNKEYWSAVNKLDALGDYKSSEKLKEACVSFSVAEKYKNAIDLFAEGKYTEASEELSSLLKDYSSGYLRAERVIMLCNAAIGNTTGNADNSGSDNTSEGADISGDGNAPDSGSENTQETTGATVRTCPQCGQSEPNAIFTEDWNPGDICFGCNYDNFHGGEKKYCSQCGADCTYRGLEEDGRCEDCYYGDNASGSDDSTTACSHAYAEATCTKPKTCTKCGATTGSAADHTWENTSCTTPKACSVCGENLIGSIPGHQWQNATCTEPEKCSVCNETQGAALGHSVELTKCAYCDHTDYSAIAKTYPNITAYDGKTGEDLEVTNVSVSSSGVLSFTFNGTSYAITIKQKNYDSMTYFDCYLNGSLLSNATCRVGDASYYNMLHFEWDGVDGHFLYFCTGKQ